MHTVVFMSPCCINKLVDCTLMRSIGWLFLCFECDPFSALEMGQIWQGQRGLRGQNVSNNSAEKNKRNLAWSILPLPSHPSTCFSFSFFPWLPSFLASFLASFFFFLIPPFFHSLPLVVWHFSVPHSSCECVFE